MRQLELEKAQKEYETAYETDSSPLAKLNLAQIYQVSGRLEEARLYAEDCLRGSDNSWMLNFGIDPDRYKRDIHEILYKTYKGLARKERFIPRVGFRDKISSLLKKITYRYKYTVHQKLYQKYSLAAANAYSAYVFEQGPHLDSIVQYFRAFEAYPRRGLAYLSAARAFETSLIPAAVPSYDLEEGILLKDKRTVEKALIGLDPLWERELISHCYREISKPKKLQLFGSKQQNLNAAQELFSLNRGSLRQNGIALPVEINISNNITINEKLILRALKKSGLKQNSAGYPSRFILSISINQPNSAEYNITCELADRETRTKTIRYSAPLKSFKKADVYKFVRAFADAVFTVE